MKSKKETRGSTHPGDDSRLNRGAGPSPSGRILQSLNAVVNSHGHAFHYAVVEELRRLHRSGNTKWRVAATEVPVPAKPNGSRIDVLVDRPPSKVYAALECKRVNPSHSNWVFFASPFVAIGTHPTEAFTEAVSVYNDGPPHTARSIRHLSVKTVQLGMEAESGEKGDCAGSGRGAIEDGLSHAVRNANGLLTYLARTTGLLQPYSPVTVIPVLVTTANLWSCDSSIAAASLRDGRVNLESAELNPVEAVVFNHHVSPMIRPEVKFGSVETFTDIHSRIAHEFFRSVIVVNGNSLAVGLGLLDELAGAL